MRIISAPVNKGETKAVWAIKALQIPFDFESHANTLTPKTRFFRPIPRRGISKTSEQQIFKLIHVQSKMAKL